MTFVKTDITFKIDDDSQYELGIYQKYNSLDWRRQMFPTIANTLQRPIQKKCFARYSDLEEDTTKSEKENRQYTPDNSGQRNLEVFIDRKNISDRTELVRSTSMPWGIIESMNYFMMYGYLDLNTVMIASPNRFKGIPSFSLQPRGIKKGKTYTFDYFMKFFAKPENTITDVCKWYAINRYSTNPLSKGLVKFPKGKVKKRVFGKGNFVSKEKYEIAPLGWMSYDEQFLTEGKWYAHFHKEPNEQGLVELTPEKLKQAYDEARAQGKYTCPYTRQIRQWYAYHDDRPPYKDWMLLSKNGHPFSYFRGAVPIEEQISVQGYLPEDMWEPLGITDKKGASRLSVHDDFCNPDFIQWYVRQHIDYLKFYDVDGFYFDMGWGTHVSPCWRHPDSGIFHGELKAIVEITNFGRTMESSKMFSIDENIHSPTIMYVDAAFMNEGGLNTDKLSIDSVKFNRVSFTNLIYPGIWKKAYGKEQVEKLLITSALANLSYGITHAASAGRFIESKEALKPFLDFSAWATPMTLVYENESIIFIPGNENITGSMWVDENDVLVAVFNNTDTEQAIKTYLDLALIREYGYKKNIDLEFQTLDIKGDGKNDVDFHVTKELADLIVISGNLPPKSLLMAR